MILRRPNSLHLRFSRFVLGPNAGGSCRQMLTVDNYNEEERLNYGDRIECKRKLFVVESLIHFVITWKLIVNVSLLKYY